MEEVVVAVVVNMRVYIEKALRVLLVVLLMLWLLNERVELVQTEERKEEEVVKEEEREGKRELASDRG